MRLQTAPSRCRNSGSRRSTVDETAAGVVCCVNCYVNVNGCCWTIVVDVWLRPLLESRLCDERPRLSSRLSSPRTSISPSLLDQGSVGCLLPSAPAWPSVIRLLAVFRGGGWLLTLVDVDADCRCSVDDSLAPPSRGCSRLRLVRPGSFRRNTTRRSVFGCDDKWSVKSMSNSLPACRSISVAGSLLTALSVTDFLTFLTADLRLRADGGFGAGSEAAVSGALLCVRVLRCALGFIVRLHKFKQITQQWIYSAIIVSS
jgi:hypothetical protein